MVPDDDATLQHVTSRDGTRVGVLSRGSGPGVVLVQGAMGTARDFDELARALAPRFAVHAPDRRGRGLSPKPYHGGHDIARDVEDVDAVLAATGATQVFGLSSGAMITLEAARTLPRVTRAAVYEPPFYARGIDRDGVRALGAAIERGDLATALALSLRVSGTLPAVVNAVPLPVARLVAALVLRVDERRRGSAPTLRELLPGIRYDFHDVAGMEGRMPTLASVGVPVLLLSGTKSAAYLRDASRTLQAALPRAALIELEGLDHGSSWNTARGGRPDVVAAALASFFA